MSANIPRKDDRASSILKSDSDFLNEMGIYRAPENRKNYGERTNNPKIDALVLHYTECNFTRSYELLTDKVSAHFLVDKDG